MIAWIVTLIDILIIFYYVKYTYYYNHEIKEEEEKVKFPIWIVLLAVFVSCIPVVRYLALIGLIIIAPITIQVINNDSYDEIRVKGFLTKGI